MMHHATKVLNPGKGYPCVFRNWRAKHSHCSKLHGYDLIFEVTLASNSYDACGWVYDFGKFDGLKREIETTFDHKLIIAADDPRRHAMQRLAEIEVADVVMLPQVSCEAFAVWLAVRATDMLMYHEVLSSVWVHKARVYEHAANSITYYPEHDK